MAWTIQFRSIGERFPQPIPTAPIQFWSIGALSPQPPPPTRPPQPPPPQFPTAPIQFRSIGALSPQPPPPTAPPQPPIAPPGSIRSAAAKSLLVDFLSQNGIVIEKESISVVFVTKDFNIIIGGLKEPISIGGTSYAYIVVDRANKKIYLASTLNSNYIAQLVSGYGGTLQVVTTYPS